MTNKVTNRFLSVPQFESLSDGVRFRVCKTFTYVDTDGRCIDIPEGFVTDFASVPPLARFAAFILALCYFIARLFPQTGTFATIIGVISWWIILIAEWLENSATDAIASVHDFIYATRCRPRWKADFILFKGMKAINSPRSRFAKRFFFWLNVRLFGWKPWIDDARKIYNRKWEVK